MQRPDMLDAAARYATTFHTNELTAQPVRHVAVLACMDARLDLFRLLGLEVGDCHLVRNAGGRATGDALRSLILSANVLGTREFVVIHHTGCGLHRTSNDALAAQVAAISGARPELDFLPFDDEVSSVGEDVARISLSPYLPADGWVWGAVYDVHHGTLTPVGVPVRCGGKGADTN